MLYSLVAGDRRESAKFQHTEVLMQCSQFDLSCPQVNKHLSIGGNEGYSESTEQINLQSSGLVFGWPTYTSIPMQLQSHSQLDTSPYIEIRHYNTLLYFLYVRTCTLD